MKYEDTEGFINYHKDNKRYPIILSIDEGYETKLEIFKGMLEDVLNKQLDEDIFRNSIQITIDKRDLSLNSYTSVNVRNDEIHMCFKDIDIDMLEEYLETLVGKPKTYPQPKAGCKTKRKELIADILYPMDVGLGGPCEDTSDNVKIDKDEITEDIKQIQEDTSDNVKIDKDEITEDIKQIQEDIETKFMWIPYDGQELEVGKNYLITTKNGTIGTFLFGKSSWKEVKIKAYMELPKPYENPKSLKERLDEAVKKYCYSFSDKEWKDNESKQYFIAYNFDSKRFEIESFGNYTTFAPYYFLDILKAQAFMYGFTENELMKIMKGEIK